MKDPCIYTFCTNASCPRRASCVRSIWSNSCKMRSADRYEFHSGGCLHYVPIESPFTATNITIDQETIDLTLEKKGVKSA